MNYRLYVVLVLAFFFIKGMDLALNTKTDVFPDESYHIELIEIYHEDEDGLIVENSPATYHLGNITHVPYFYHMLGGKILYLNFFGVDDLVFLRTISLVFSTLTCFFIFKLAQKITDNKLVWLLTLIIAVNIPIFTFMSAAINYDALTNFFAITSVYLLIVFIEKKKLLPLILLIVSLCLGAITKISFIPLALAIGLLLLFSLRKQILKKNFWKEKYTELRTNKAYIALLLLSIILIIGTAQFYIKNLLNYHNLLPSCDQILSQEDCMVNPVYRRDKGLEETAQIENPVLKSFPEYSMRWFYLMLERSVNEIGHQSLLRPKFVLFIYASLLLFAYTGFVRRYYSKQHKINYLLAITISYAFVLLYFQNYSAYRQNANESIGLQGRYILPIIGPISVMLAQGFLMFKKQWVNILVIILLSIFVITSDYIYFRSKAGDNFFAKDRYQIISTYER
ncbi:MAG: hypothetical protein US52_C0017G0011 [candidate division WS6 bacterium GW2011_GWA2_37_6]|uniref:Uncharacterized protein n=1 Tax=candidate division WS6 bacterium GW2011_GWA2_37_6 TaxID=1619087 RepID=A0A0G0JG17_9BACT|nr:MAG: hypothetical protein US52_C0017G0011 [candidate division WS6 bacterium GW2011_GWA2_37_6]